MQRHCLCNRGGYARVQYMEVHMPVRSHLQAADFPLRWFQEQGLLPLPELQALQVAAGCLLH